MVFAEGDLVSVDLGMFYRGFHTDTSFSVLVGKDSQKEHFLEAGREAINKAISQARVGKPLGDISRAIETTLERQGYHPVTSLVGHGVGRELHEAPAIPCFTSGSAQEKMVLEPGMVLAIEVMYTLGSPELVTDSDGWTIRTQDGKISALFEETVAVTASGSLVLTKI
jgi:methionyl aminopeptidase